MSVPSAQFEHPGPWTEDEFWGLPETGGQRIELLDGSLLMSPAPKSGHQRVARRLANLLEAGVPTGWDVIVEVNVRLLSGRILIPDVVVARVQKDAAVYEPPDLALVAEVASPSTRVQGLLLKRGLYETAGIPGYLLIEHDTDGGPRLLLYRLDGHTYTEHGRAGVGEALDLEEPAVTIDPAMLPRQA